MVNNQEKIAVLLLNLGTPASPNFWSIRRYLKEFLSDPRVIEVNRVLWWLILNGFILNFRPFKLIKWYRSIWTAEGSPLRVESQKQVKALQEKLGEAYVVILGMRYGLPSLKSSLLKLRESAGSRLIILPLYPQNSGATTGSAFDAVTRLFESCRHIPSLKFISGYHRHPSYIQAMTSRIQQFWRVQGRPQKLVLSFHGLPEQYCNQGDPYFLQCQETTRQLVDSLKLSPEEWAMSFQSRVGQKAWLKPYTDELLRALPVRGVQDIHVFCPGFSADCLETLEEVSIRNKALFLDAGGHSYRYISALNDSPEHIQMMMDLIVESGFS